MPGRVLVVYKKSAFQLHVLERNDRRLITLMGKRDPAMLDMRQAHDVHETTLRNVMTELERLPVRVTTAYRERLSVIRGFDLVISVGGDGTFLQASHFITGRTPVLGINSDPRRSEAAFGDAGASQGTRPTPLARLLRRAVNGELPTRRLHRLQVFLNRRALLPLVLNDVLIAHNNPATMSRYRLRIGRVSEDQKSSGLWVATASGSSSAILAAGGRRMSWTSTAFQYRPRELYEGRLTRYRLKGGVLAAGRPMEITWLMREGALFIDGPHVKVPFGFGDQLTVAPASRPLYVLGSPNR